jgi:oxygen-dependent protoporphyrinogen oxidase
MKETIRANKLVSTVPAYAVSEILPFLPKEKTAILDKLYYAPVVEAPLGFHKWEGMPLDGFGGLVPHKEGRDILGAMFMSTLFEGRAPEGGALMTIFMGGVRKAYLTEQEDHDLLTLLFQEIKPLFGLKNMDELMHEILHHPKAIPQYYADTGQRLEAIADMEAQNPGLILGGNMCGGIGMADRIKQGKEMAMQIPGKNEQ